MVSGKRVLIFVFLVLIMSAGTVFALTGSIGNARMVLYGEVGDSLEKSILVKNVNDVPVTIDIFVSGDLVDDITLQDEIFTLEAGEERKAYFTIDIKETGMFESNVQIRFTPEDEGNGVGLGSTVIVFASGVGERNVDETNDGDESDSQDNDTPSGNSGVSFGNRNPVTREPTNSFGIVEIGLSITGIIVLALVILFISYIFMTRNKSIDNIKKNNRKNG